MGICVCCNDAGDKPRLILDFLYILIGISYLLLVAVPSRSSSKVVSIQTQLQCNTEDSFFQDCSKIDGDCLFGLNLLANSSHVVDRKSNESISCSVKCQSESDTLFSSCFTNDSGPYNENRCNGTLSQTRHLNFVIPDLNSVLTSDITKPNVDIGSVHCRDYDLKRIEFEEGNTHKAFQILCQQEISLKCSLSCSENLNLPCDNKPESFDKTFYLFFIIFLLANVTFAPIFPLLDAVAYDILQENRQRWGKQRLWGTLGFALFAVTSTFIMHFRSKHQQDINYNISFYVFAPLCFLASVIAYFFDISTNIKCSQLLKNVGQLLTKFEILAFLTVVMYFGMLTGAMEAFLFWFLIGLNSSPLVFGFQLLVNCCAEFPMLWVAGSILQKTGLVGALYLALLGYALRMMGYSLLQNPWFVLLIEPLHGLCFALMYAAASSYASIIAPPGMSATMQGLLGGMHFGFGKGIGSLITGFMFEGIGPRWTWGLYSIVSMVLLAIYVVLNVFVFKPHPSKESPAAPENNGNGGVLDKPEVESKPEENLLNHEQNSLPVGTEDA